MKPIRSPKYLAWIRSFRCVVCDAPAPSHAHHYGRGREAGGMGLKPDDYRTVPLCWRCHGEYHQKGSEAFGEATGFDHTAIIEIQLKFLTLYTSHMEETGSPPCPL